MIVLYTVVGIIALFFGMQLRMIVAAKRAKGAKLSGLQGNLKGLEKEGSRGLVYFYSPSCGACKMQTPIIKSMQAENKDVYSVDISKDQQSARIFGIRATPSTILVKDGKIKEVFLGAKSEATLMQLLEVQS